MNEEKRIDLKRDLKKVGFFRKEADFFGKRKRILFNFETSY